MEKNKVTTPHQEVMCPECQLQGKDTSSDDKTKKKMNRTDGECQLQAEDTAGANK